MLVTKEYLKIELTYYLQQVNKKNGTNIQKLHFLYMLIVLERLVYSPRSALLSGCGI